MSLSNSSLTPHTPLEHPLTTHLHSLPLTPPLLLATVLVLVLSLLAIKHNKTSTSTSPSIPPPPLANPPRWNQTVLSKRLEFLRNGRAIMNEARQRYGRRPYRLITDTGEVFILPPEYAVTIRNEGDLSFSKAIEENFSGYLSGFEPFGALHHPKRLVQNVVRKQLTRSLNTITKPLSDETTHALNVILDTSPAWQETTITEAILQLIARLSTRVFLGATMCRNETWLAASKSYTVSSITLSLQIAALPRFLKHLVPYLSPSAKRVRQQLADLRALLTPLLAQRAALKAEARRTGDVEPLFDDMIEWYERESGGEPYDAAVFQSLLSVAAIHTTSELLTNTLTLVAREPGYVEALREEIVRVLRAEGMTKAALAGLKLMDSACKETQRFRPGSLLGMRRFAQRTLILPDGTRIPKHTQVAVDSINMLDPAVYPSPDTFDIYRYYRMRQDPATASKAHFVSTGPDNLSFGHGAQACPGRFFAANEVKIALCHLLLKYDWEVVQGKCDTEARHVVGETMGLDRGNRLRFRRRVEEVDLDNLAFV